MNTPATAMRASPGQPRPGGGSGPRPGGGSGTGPKTRDAFVIGLAQNVILVGLIVAVAGVPTW